ncbi:alpha/beta hydrolase [Alteromonas mediterranea]|uniref:alpha/beta hydrolase n=1 Tax=Alteromonas mediterranea TaxID=314275 RepID=UPI001132137E|nr:alpha/beta hydrolase [Alteromonas mediterranea]QDG39544.1 alpha/beta hydrolase [Alteromonas mediterranea]
MKVIFSHGKESGPNGRKIKALSDIALSLNFAVESIDYRFSLDPEKRVEHLSTYLNELDTPFILVGSSMGGYVSAVNAMQHSPVAVFLMAPAFYLPNYKTQTFNLNCHTEIVHGWQDDIVPISNSIQFAEQHNFRLHAVPGNHSLNDALEDVCKLFEVFLNRILKKVP